MCFLPDEFHLDPSGPRDVGVCSFSTSRCIRPCRKSLLRQGTGTGQKLVFFQEPALSMQHVKSKSWKPTVGKRMGPIRVFPSPKYRTAKGCLNMSNIEAYFERTDVAKSPRPAAKISSPLQQEQLQTASFLQEARAHRTNLY